MNGKFWTSAIVATIAYWLLGGFFYAWLMKDWFASQSTGMDMTDPNMALITLMCVAYGFLMAYTYPLGYRGGAAAKEGLRFGILFALIVNLPSGLSIVAMGMWSWIGFIVGLIWELVVGALLGFITAKIYAGSAKTA